MQAKGLTGHIEVAGRPYDHKAWDESDPPKVPSLLAYEQTGYRIDGGLRCRYLSGDYVLDHPDTDG